MLRLECVRGAVFHPAALDLLRLVALPHQGRDVCFYFIFFREKRSAARVTTRHRIPGAQCEWMYGGCVCVHVGACEKWQRVIYVNECHRPSRRQNSQA